ncbi:MAG: hypothetical protein ACYC9O_16455 [Candidatus Latescibacterota bacterium]
MKAQTWRYLGMIGITVLILDWIVGAMCTAGALPQWVFLLLNIPFGAIYVFMESSWTGTHYQIFGQIVGDLGSGTVFLFVVMAQSLCYFFLFELFRKKRVLKGVG